MLLGLLASIVCGFDTTRPFFYYIGVFVAVAVLLSGIFLPTRFLIYPLFLLMINMLDLTQAAEDQVEYGEILTASPWQFRLGPFPPAVLVFVCLVIIGLRLYKVGKDSWHTRFYVYFFVVVTIVSLWFGYAQEDIARFLADAKVPLFFGIGLVIFGGYYQRYPQSVLVSSQIFLALLGGHFILDLIYLFLGVSTSMASGFKNVSIDSGKGMVALLIFWGLGNLLNRRQAIFSVIMSIISFYLLLSYQTRWLIVSLAVGLLVMVPILLGTKRVLKIYIPVILISFVSIPVLIQVRPEAWEVMRLRFSFIENLGPGAKLEDIETIRAAAIYNATGVLIENKALLTGMGYGSWYDGRFYPMPTLTMSAFDAQSLNSGRYYRVHDFTFQFLFKFGIIGLFIYAMTFLSPLRTIWKLRKQVLANEWSRSVAIILFAATPLVATNMWFTGKGLLFSGFFVCISQAWARSFQKSLAPANVVVASPKLKRRKPEFALPV